MRPSVGRDDAEAVVRLDELKHRLGRHHDLANKPIPDERRRADDAGDAPERGIVLVAERLRLRLHLRLVQTAERLSADPLTLSLAVHGGCLRRNEIVPGPPHAGHIRMTIRRAWN